MIDQKLNKPNHKNIGSSFDIIYQIVKCNEMMDLTTTKFDNTALI